MLKKKLALILCLCLAVTTIFGCGKSGDTGSQGSTSGGKKVLTWNNGPECSTMDPGLNSGNDASQMFEHMYEGLLREVDNKMEPAMAESYDVSEDNLTYTFHLRDAKWSDGVAVKAGDFEFAWKRALDPEVASPYQWIFEAACIESFKAIDDKTFEVKLSSNAPYFLSLLCTSTFLPLREDKIDYKDGGWALDPSRVVTNGPFTMTSYVSGDKLVLEKNQEYWEKDKIKLDEIDVLMITDATTALTGFESGEIDCLREVPPAEIPRLLSENSTFTTVPANGSSYICFNQARKPFDDVRVRKALTLAINRTAIVNDVTKGGQIPATCIVPGVIYDSDGKSFPEVAGDHGIAIDDSKFDEAKQLLADAGYPNGEGFPTVEYLYNTSDTNKAVAETLQQMWKENLGITVNLVNMESSVFHQTRVAHNFDICNGGWGGDYNDPLTYLDMFIPDAMPNYSDWRNEEYTNLVNAGKNTVGKERFDDFYKAEKILMDEACYCPLYYSVNQQMVSKSVTNWSMTTTGLYNFNYADISK